MNVSIKNKVTTFKSKLKTGLDKNINLANKIKDNAAKALDDIKSGKAVTDKDSFQNLSNTLSDIAKVVGQGAFLAFVPGSTLALPALKKLLHKHGPETLKINRLLDLSVETIEEELKENKIDDNENK